MYGHNINNFVGVMPMCRRDLEQLINYFNEFNTAVEFPWTISESSIKCVDVLMTLTQDDVSISNHYKPTDSHSYLHHSSHNPKKL